MNRSQIVAIACKELGFRQQEDLDDCADFVTLNASLLWARALWKDSVAQFTSTVDTDGTAGMSTALWIPSRATFVCPPMVERIMGARFDSQYLVPEDPSVYFRYNPEAFDESGTPMQYHLLSPCVYEWDSETAAQLQCDPPDEGAIITVSYLDSDDFTVTTADFTMIDRPLDIATTLRIDKITKSTTTGSIFLCITTGPQSLVTNLVTLTATDTAALRRQRIRFVKMPDQDRTLRLLVKIQMPDFDGDHDTPPIQGSERYLIAASQANMYTRERQKGKADDKLKEAEAYFNILVAQETVQQAYRQRIIPETGYGGGDWNQLESSKADW